MNNIFNVSEKIANIVIRFPKASEVFKSYNIDFCCGGNKPLSEAIEKNGLDPVEVIRKLEEAYEEASKLKDSGKDLHTFSPGELIDYIVNTHHVYLQSELPKTGELITKILRAHGANHGEMLAKVHKQYNNLRMELEQHLIKEEEIVFPLIKRYEKQPSQEFYDKINETIVGLEAEHEGAGDIIKDLRRITGHYAVPEDGCTTFRLTYRKLEEMESDLFQHIHLENNILFPRFKK